jgi:pseudouridine kinase
LSGIPYKSQEDLPKIADYFINQGTQHVFISLGSEGSYYADKDFKGIFQSVKLELVNVSGAGDAFIAGTVYSLLNKKNIHDTVLFSTAMAIATILSESAVNENVSEAYIEQIIKKYNLC